MQTVRCSAVPCRAVPCRAVPCRAVPRRATQAPKIYLEECVCRLKDHAGQPVRNISRHAVHLSMLAGMLNDDENDPVTR